MPGLEQAEVELTVVVGAASLSLAQVMALSRGDIISLGRDATGPITVLANGAEFSKAAVTLIGDRVAFELPREP